MRYLLIMTLAFFGANASAQSLITQRPGFVDRLSATSDSTTQFKLVCKSTFNPDVKIAFFVDDKLEPSIHNINPNQIEKILVVRDSIRVDSIQYVGQIRITLKEHNAREK
jgi:hypothetical protein